MNILLTLIIHLLIGGAIAYFIKPWHALIAGIIGAVAGIFFTFLFNMELPQPQLSNLLTSAGIASFYAALCAFLAGVSSEKNHRRKREANRVNSEPERTFRR
ncbi:hypothetical protein IQ238_12115 [Pleurocapsales cyanobacterium LEGE 06147]|nr:hypothetical protein [Pleurocapsales cyanobacterium LEGE 06147]